MTIRPSFHPAIHPSILSPIIFTHTCTPPLASLHPSISFSSGLSYPGVHTSLFSPLSSVHLFFHNLPSPHSFTQRFPSSPFFYLLMLHVEVSHFPESIHPSILLILHLNLSWFSYMFIHPSIYLASIRHLVQSSIHVSSQVSHVQASLRSSLPPFIAGSPPSILRLLLFLFSVHSSVLISCIRPFKMSPTLVFQTHPSIPLFSPLHHPSIFSSSHLSLRLGCQV